MTKERREGKKNDTYNVEIFTINKLIYSKKMSLTLFFIVLSIAIGYLLYDTFKKSRQAASKTTVSSNKGFKINYSHQCAVLNDLSKEKLSSLKTKTISISLSENITQPSVEEINKIRLIITKTLQNRRIYLLEKKGQSHNATFNLLKQLIGQQFCIPYSSIDGAVAILRQLSTGLHLQSNAVLYSKVKQYLGKIWIVGEDPGHQALRQFKSDIQMLSFLENLQSEQQVQ